MDLRSALLFVFPFLIPWIGFGRGSKLKTKVKTEGERLEDARNVIDAISSEFFKSVHSVDDLIAVSTEEFGHKMNLTRVFLDGIIRGMDKLKANLGKGVVRSDLSKVPIWQQTIQGFQNEMYKGKPNLEDYNNYVRSMWSGGFARLIKYARELSPTTASNSGAFSQNQYYQSLLLILLPLLLVINKFIPRQLQPIQFDSL